MLIFLFSVRLPQHRKNSAFLMLGGTRGVIEIYSKIQKATGFDFDEIGEPLTALCIPATQLIRVLTILFHDVELSYKRLVDIVVVDFPHGDKQFDVHYVIMSMLHNHQLDIIVEIEEETQISSVSGVYGAAYYRECKMAESFGIKFTDRKKLRNVWGRRYERRSVS